jgi:DNA-binding winged helix-turn-helix (wHTH) protein
MASFRIAGWLAEPDLNTFSRDAHVVRVEPKVMELCVRLAQAPGKVVSKTELLESVWRDATVNEDALTRAISELRRALEDDARHPKILETIPKRGYRFICEVRPDTTETAEAVALPLLAPKRRSERLPMTMAAGLALALVFAVAVTLLQFRESAPNGAPTLAPRSVLVVGTAAAGSREALRAVLGRLIDRAITDGRRYVVIPDHRVAETLRLMRRSDERMTVEVALEIAQREAPVAAIVFSQLEEIAGTPVLTLQTLNPSTARATSTAVIRGRDEHDLIARAESGVPALRTHLDALPFVPAAPLPRVTTSSLAALRLFDQALTVAHSVMAPEAAPWSSAVELFSKALEDDAEFAMAHAWLAYALKKADDVRLSYFGSGERQSVVESRRHANEALRLLGAVADRERLLIEGVAHVVLEHTDTAVARLEALLWADSTYLEVPTRALLATLYAAQSKGEALNAQIVRLAELKPDDFDLNGTAAQILVARDGDTRAAAPYVSRARRARTPAIAQRENSWWHAAWLDHLSVYEQWARGEHAAAVETLSQLTTTLSSRASGERDAFATTHGFMWLSIGRMKEAQTSFEAVGHFGQRATNLSHLGDLVDDLPRVRSHLNKLEYAYNPAPFARAGLFDRARAIMGAPGVGSHRSAYRAIALAEDALASGRFDDAIPQFQLAADQLRRARDRYFYNTLISLARAWQGAGNASQAVRALEEAAKERPPYMGPGLPAAWWIKARVLLARAYRAVGRHADADRAAAEVRQDLRFADPDHPFLRALATTPPRGSFLSISE